jgi:hypothetical protein
VPKTWDDSKQNLGYIRNAGTRQFISTYNRVKDLKGDELLWGDETEYGIFHIDSESKKVRLSLRAKEVRSVDYSMRYKAIGLHYLTKYICLSLFYHPDLLPLV